MRWTSMTSHHASNNNHRMMKRRQPSPAREQRSPLVLPQMVKNNYEKRKKPGKSPCKAMMKSALLSKRRAPAAACLITAGALMLLVFQQLKHSVRNEERPIILHLHRDSLYKGVIPLALSNHPFHLISDRQNHYWIDHGTKLHKPEYEQDSNDGKCVSMGEWQNDRNIMACNPFHEVNLQSPSLLNVGEGTYRNAWAFEEYDGVRQVIKTLVWSDDMDWDDFAAARKEAMAMAQATKSKYVANIYGACSHSIVMDYSEKGILWWLFDDFEPTKDELFQIANDVARGVADAQNVDSQGRATIAHMDIKANQFILINGTYKINDFNMCEFLKWDPEAEEYCEFDGGYVGRWQAPEQINRRTYLDDEKSDVFSLGYVLFFLATGDQQWAGESSHAAAKWALRGLRPEIPESIANSEHPFDVAVIAAMEKCWQQNPKDRPTATEIADFLHDALLKAGLTDQPLKITTRAESTREKSESSFK